MRNKLKEIIKDFNYDYYAIRSTDLTKLNSMIQWY